MLVFGTLVYNEIVVLPFWGLDYNTRDNIAKREAAGGQAELAKGPDENERLYESVDGKDSNANSDAPNDRPNA